MLHKQLTAPKPDIRLCLCSFRGDLAARPRWAGRTLSWALDMANFENVPVQLTGFEMENSSMLWSVFISEVGRNVKVTFAKHLVVLLMP